MPSTDHRRFMPETLVALRKCRGLTQQQLADGLGMSRQIVSRWERNRHQPEINSLPKLAELLGCRIDQLFEPIPQPGES